mmetsp:Transcript_9960/g.31617  ORF Transcript_9960/g.31617 Transcript_9960/m.31617 type:complete len:201 (-) Transcript_9960:1746-2348(-)
MRRLAQLEAHAVAKQLVDAQPLTLSSPELTEEPGQQCDQELPQGPVEVQQHHHGLLQLRSGTSAAPRQHAGHQPAGPGPGCRSGHQEVEVLQEGLQRLRMALESLLLPEQAQELGAQLPLGPQSRSQVRMPLGHGRAAHHLGHGIQQPLRVQNNIGGVLEVQQLPQAVEQGEAGLKLLVCLRESEGLRQLMALLKGPVRR